MQQRSFRLRTLFVFALMLAGLAAASGADTPEPAGESARPLIVKVHADWCGTCRGLEPTWEALIERYGDRADFVVLDVSNDAASAKSAGVADERGIGAFFAEYGRKTGIVAVLDAQGELLHVLKGEFDVENYAAPIGDALGTS